MTSEPVAALIAEARYQAALCAVAGSPTWAAVITAAADDLEVDPPGPLGSVLLADAARRSGAAPGRTNPLLRLTGALHRIALGDPSCPLRRWLPSTGGTSDPAAAAVAARVVAADAAADLIAATAAPVQTNEAGRAAPLSAAVQAAVRRHPLPVRLLEIGASAGLNLLLDRYRVESEGRGWGPPDSPVRLVDRFIGEWPVPVDYDVVDRRGCDLDPVDVRSDEGRDLLRSFVWPEQLDRAALLDAAVTVARSVPVAIDRSAGGPWLGRMLATPAPGTLTVVFHSVVAVYLDPGERAAIAASLGAAGRRASADAPVAHVAMEPAEEGGADGTMVVTLETWPGGDRTVVATCGPHGDRIEWRRTHSQ